MPSGSFDASHITVLSVAFISPEEIITGSEGGLFFVVILSSLLGDDSYPSLSILVTIRKYAVLLDRFLIVIDLPLVLSANSNLFFLSFVK